MSSFMIGGRYGCPNTAHAVLVAEYLNKHLPNFRFRNVSKTGDWESWLETVNEENKWHHTESPIIWKEVSGMGFKPYLIGGLGEFWEYCYDYYGFQSRMPKSDLLKLVEDMENLNSDKSKIPFVTTISIIGAHTKTTDFLLLELESNYQVRSNEEVKIRLYDENYDDAEQNAYLLDMVDHIKSLLQIDPKNLTIVSTLVEAIDQCDILILIKDYTRKSMEDMDNWLQRCHGDMILLASEINMYAKRTMKIILCHPGPVCFNASLLIENCTTIRLANVVCVTVNEGLEYIDTVSQKSSLEVEEINCPPVWGFSGIRSFVDISSVFVLAKVFRPFLRALKSKEHSTLYKGRIKKEMRMLSFLKNDEALQKAIFERKRIELKLMRRTPILTQVRAFGSLIKLWFSDEPKDNIISLGVISNGSFGFPPGVVFSQSVILNEKNIWEPFSNFPITKIAQKEINSILVDVKDILERYRLGAAME